MDRFGTKSRGERENEEVERLVRPSPKIKPPRHDRRRERVEVDEDPDLSTKDKDLSKNFKDIGGSVAAKIVKRWAGNLPLASSKPKPPPPAGQGAKPPAKPEGEKVKVRSKATGWVGWISKERLKSDPGSYEVAESGDDETFGDTTKAKPSSAPDKPKPAADHPQPKEEAPRSAEKDAAAQAKLKAIAKEDPSFAAFLKSFRNPESQVAQFAKGNPGFKAKPFMQGKELPEGVETIGDLARVLAAPAAKKHKKPPSGADSGERSEIKTRLQEVKQELAEDPKSDGAKKERSALRDALRSMDEADRLTAELAEAKAQLEALDKKGEPTEEEVRELAQKILNRTKKAPTKKAPPPAAAPPKAEEAPAEPEAEAPQSNPGPQQPDSAPAPDAPLEEGKPSSAPAAPSPEAEQPQPPAAPAKPTKLEKQPKAPKEKPKDKNKPEEHKYAPKYVPGQPTRNVSSSERRESDRLVMRTFPAQVASKILFANPPYHPDEVKLLVADYNKAKSISPTMVPELLKKAPSFYATDASSVPPPKKLGNDGQELTDEQKAQAIRQHQIQTVAMSLATRALVSDNLKRNGASEDLAGSLSDFLLSGRDEAPADRSKRAAHEAEEIFLAGLQRNGKPMSDSEVKNLLQQVANYDPALEKLVVGYCQSRDYQEARELFLSPKSKTAISEYQSPRQIAAGISKAAEFLRKRSERYPEGSTAQDTYMIFRNRVMSHLATLDADKQAQVQEILDQQDNRYYDAQLRKYEKSMKAYEKQVEQAEKEFSKDFRAYSKRMRETGNFDEDPPLTVEDRLVQARLESPIPPVKPPNYDKLTTPPEDMARESEDLWKQFQQRNASDVSVLSIGDLFSIYPDTFAMDRTAVYWGVAPYPKGEEGVEPYRAWEQPQARDLGDSDFSRILKAAREWLKTPVLSTNIEGIVRDTQLRAALDLALRAENCGHAIHPTVYNKLLARLAGVSEDETLLTVRSKTARNTMSNKKVELETAQADRFLARLDRIASVVQSNHKQWGMDFTAAKNLVNAIDKLADDLESATYGEDSLLNRQATEIGHEKLAQVIQRDSDEGYMETFKNPQKPIQTEADEPYMKAYSSDDSSGVRSGKATNGRPLAK